jgi:hypothetical protein
MNDNNKQDARARQLVAHFRNQSNDLMIAGFGVSDIAKACLCEAWQLHRQQGHTAECALEAFYAQLPILYSNDPEKQNRG